MKQPCASERFNAVSMPNPCPQCNILFNTNRTEYGKLKTPLAGVACFTHGRMQEWKTKKD